MVWDRQGILDIECIDSCSEIAGHIHRITTDFIDKASLIISQTTFLGDKDISFIVSDISISEIECLRTRDSDEMMSIQDVLESWRDSRDIDTEGWAIRKPFKITDQTLDECSLIGCEEVCYFTEILFFLVWFLASSDDIDTGIDELSFSELLLESGHQLAHRIGLHPDYSLDLLITDFITECCIDTLTTRRVIECPVIESHQDIAIDIREAKLIGSDPTYRSITIDRLRPCRRREIGIRHIVVGHITIDDTHCLDMSFVDTDEGK